MEKAAPGRRNNSLTSFNTQSTPIHIFYKDIFLCVFVYQSDISLISTIILNINSREFVNKTCTVNLISCILFYKVLTVNVAYVAYDSYQDHRLIAHHNRKW